MAMGSSAKTYLPGLPAPFQCESVGSWMQRVCQVYDLTFSKFHESFGTTQSIDPDLAFRFNDFKRFSRISRIPNHKFWVMRNILGRIAQNSRLRTLRRRRPGGGPRGRGGPGGGGAGRI